MPHSPVLLAALRLLPATVAKSYDWRVVVIAVDDDKPGDTCAVVGQVDDVGQCLSALIAKCLAIAHLGAQVGAQPVLRRLFAPVARRGARLAVADGFGGSHVGKQKPKHDGRGDPGAEKGRFHTGLEKHGCTSTKKKGKIRGQGAVPLFLALPRGGELRAPHLPSRPISSRSQVPLRKCTLAACANPC